MVNEVPASPVVELTTEIRPPRRSTMPLTTHSPIPVPLSPLVVKNGSKMVPMFSTGTPHPVSSNGYFHFVLRIIFYRQIKAAVLSHRIRLRC